MKQIYQAHIKQITIPIKSNWYKFWKCCNLISVGSVVTGVSVGSVVSGLSVGSVASVAEMPGVRFVNTCTEVYLIHHQCAGFKY
jgi:hypothetical protein